MMQEVFPPVDVLQAEINRFGLAEPWARVPDLGDVAGSAPRDFGVQAGSRLVPSHSHPPPWEGVTPMDISGREGL